MRCCCAIGNTGEGSISPFNFPLPDDKVGRGIAGTSSRLCTHNSPAADKVAEGIASIGAYQPMQLGGLIASASASEIVFAGSVQMWMCPGQCVTYICCLKYFVS